MEDKHGTIHSRRMARVAPLLAAAILPLADAFVMVSPHGISCSRLPMQDAKSSNSYDTGLFGILDDMMAAENGGSPVEDVGATANPEFEALLNDLVFSALDTRSAVLQRLDQILAGNEDEEPAFLLWLEDTKSNAPGVGEDERSAFSELAGAIREVQQETLAKAKEAAVAAAARDAEEAAAEEARAEEGRDKAPVMSAAEVLKKANQIDQAMVAADADEEGAGDFISDCKEVVNLSSKFNSRGQMRVGG